MGTPEEVRFWAYRISQMVAESELECIRILTKQIRHDLGASRHHVRVLADTARLRAALIKQLDGDWEKILNEAQQVLNQAAEAGQADAHMDIVEAFNRTPVPVSDQTLNAITMLARETSSVLMQAPALILRDVLDHYREFMSQPVTNVVMGASTTRQALQQALGNYAHNGVTTFQDKSGRFWRLDSYAEMAVRTGAAHAMRYGYQQTAIANGFDLVQVTGNTYTCDKCGPWQGKILSISPLVGAGTHRYPHAVTGELVTVHVAGTLEQARSEGLFHPNCTHHVGAHLPGVSHLPSVGVEEDPATYEASQKQRALEREIRKLKREQIAVLDGADGSKMREIRKYQKELRELLAEYPKLQRKPYREKNPTASMPQKPLGKHYYD